MYNKENLKKTNPNVYESADRLFWFQVAPSNDSISSSNIDIRHVHINKWYILIINIKSKFHDFFILINKYHLDLCKNVFREGVYPVVDTTNVYYGGKNIAGMNYGNYYLYVNFRVNLLLVNFHEICRINIRHTLHFFTFLYLSI